MATTIGEKIIGFDTGTAKVFPVLFCFCVTRKVLICVKCLLVIVAAIARHLHSLKIQKIKISS